MSVAPGRFFLPGPTEVAPEVLEAQARPVIGHRGPEVRALMDRLQVGLQNVFRTRRPVLVSTSSATGLMEAAVRNGVRRRMLSLVNGAFSARFARIGVDCGKDVDVFEVPWGRVHEPAEVGRRLDSGLYDAVSVVHSETSTGSLEPLSEIAEVVAAHDEVVLLVDSVTGVGGAPLETDAWGLDFVLTGSQKALALPPGLSFAVASESMLERAASLPGRGFYFDLVRFARSAEALQTPTTPAVTLMYALDAQLSRIASEGVEARWARHMALARICHRWVERLGCERGVEVGVLAPPGNRSPTVTCVRLPEGVDGSDVVARVRERGWVIGGGYGKLKQNTIRIGHMGDHTASELEALLDVLEEVLLP